jgi:hypothetical protein
VAPANRRRAHASHQSLDDREVPTIAADQAVASDQPHISAPRYRLSRRLWDVILHVRRRRFVIRE